jgi:hypothetical protein
MVVTLWYRFATKLARLIVEIWYFIIMKQHHLIEIFSADCPLCKNITDDIQIGKCEGCSLSFKR